MTAQASDYIRVLQRFIIERLNENKGMTPTQVRTIAIMIFHLAEALENIPDTKEDT